MKPSWEERTLDFSELHSYVVKNPSPVEERWVVADQVIGKGFALHCLNVTGRHKVNPGIFISKQEWVVHLMDHCAP